MNMEGPGSILGDLPTARKERARPAVRIGTCRQNWSSPCLALIAHEARVGTAGSRERGPSRERGFVGSTSGEGKDVLRRPHGRLPGRPGSQEGRRLRWPAGWKPALPGGQRPREGRVRMGSPSRNFGPRGSGTMEHGPEESPPHGRRAIDGNRRTRMRRQRRSDPNRTPPVKDRPCTKPVATGRRRRAGYPTPLPEPSWERGLPARRRSVRARHPRHATAAATCRTSKGARSSRASPFACTTASHQRSAPSWPPSSNAWRRTSATLTVEDASKQPSTAVTAPVSWRIRTSLAWWPMRCGASMANAIAFTPGA